MIDLTKLSDKELEELPYLSHQELKKRREERCEHVFRVAWNYHKNEEDTYSVCRKCGKIGRVEDANGASSW